MKALFILLTIASSIPSFANDFGQVDSNELRNVLADCRGAEREVNCLRRGVRRLIRLSEQGSGNRPNLTCRSGSNGQFAVFDEDRRRFLDGHYRKSAQVCRTSIRYAHTGLICSVGSNGRYAVRQIDDARFLSPNFSIDFDSCLKSVRRSTRSYVCIAGSNGRYARYNRETRRYLDTNYSLSLEDCTFLIPQN